MVVAVAVVVANVVADVADAVVDFSSPICFREMLRVSRKNPLFLSRPLHFFRKKKSAASRRRRRRRRHATEKRRDFDDVKKATLQRDKQRMLAATHLRNILMSRFGFAVLAAQVEGHWTTNRRVRVQIPLVFFSLLLFSTKSLKGVSLLSGNCETSGISLWFGGS